MSESTRPSMQAVQRSLIVGGLVGLILGCAFGAGLVGLYIRQSPPVYQGGAYPKELTNAYQNHYLAMVIDSYIVNQEADVAEERLKTFDQPTKIRMLGERSAAYVEAGRAVEAQLINNLALTLKGAEDWSDDTIKVVVGELTVKYQSDPARAQAINTFSAQLLEGQVPVVPSPEAPAPAEPAEAEAPAPTPAPPPPAGGISWLQYLLCCLVLIVVGLIVFVLLKRLQARRAPAKPEVVWEGEGAPPLKRWSGTYEFGNDLYDEFFTIETDDGDFLGESGMGILEALPGTSPKQVVAFDVGLFDKTDITTLSRVVMSEHAYNDEAIRAKVEANPQAEAVLAEPGATFIFETTAMRVEAMIDELEYGEDGNVYFNKLKVSLDVFLKEGADLRRGEMDIPDEYK
jgi:hypothetical protein